MAPNDSSRRGKLSAKEPVDDRELVRACMVTWRIYHFIGDPNALALFNRARRGDNRTTADRLERMLPGWCRSNQTRRRLSCLLLEQFRRDPEASQAAIDERRGAVALVCEEFCRDRYNDEAEARKVGLALADIAWGQLDAGFVAQARAARTLMRELEQLERGRSELNRLAMVIGEDHIPAKLGRSVVEWLRATEPDPLIGVLHEFFSVKNGYWRKFFDKSGRVRTRKHPNLPSMRKRLFEVLHDFPCEHPVTKGEALELAAECMKAAHAPVFGSTLNGESVRGALHYHRVLQELPPEARPRYTPSDP